MRRIERISAIVTAHDEGAFVVETVRSLREQTRPPHEILVVDDHSQDAGSLRALDSVAGIDGVRVLRQPVNQGVSRARNRGIDESSGDAMVFIDGDDMFTHDTLEQYARALDATPHAGFAYPTVSCFGNRNDTFPAPEFNLYALHQVNICPIASMVRRMVTDAGVRFADDVNPEDWDFWLQATHAGFLGVAVPEAVLLWRRWGFTRLSEATRADGGLEQAIRRRRPEYFTPDLLARLKREWAPALTIVAPHADGDRDETQITEDYEVVPAEGIRTTRGRYLLLAPDGAGSFLDGDPLFVEKLLALHEALPQVDAVLLVSADRLRRPLPLLAPVTEDDLVEVPAPPEALVAISVVRHGPFEPLLTDDEAVWPRVHGQALWLAQHAPAAITVRVGPAARGAFDQGTARTADHVAPPAGNWMDGLLRSMAPATTWRSNPASAPWTPSLVSLNRVTDTLGGVTYYAPDDPLPAGLTVGDEAFSVLRAASFGAAPLYRVIDGEGRRGVSADGSTGGVRVERLLGYVESAPVPGSRMLAGADGRVFGWVYPASLVPEVDHATLLGETRPWWRTIETTGGRHRYGIPRALRLMADEGLTLEGVVTHLLVEPSAEGDSHPVYPLLEGDIVRGLTTDAAGGHGFAAGARPAGHLLTTDGPGRRPIWLQHHPATGDLLCSNIENEGMTAGYRMVELLGFEPGSE